MASEQTEAPIDLDALEAITEAVEAGAGLPEVVRAAARALDASLVLIDRSSAVLAVAALLGRRARADDRRRRGPGARAPASGTRPSAACGCAAAAASRRPRCCGSSRR